MATDWHHLPEENQQVDPGKLTQDRSVGLLAAIDKREDIKLQWCARLEHDDQLLCETIVVDFACDGVPSRNNVGIGIPERLAIRIAPNSKWPIEVRALRKGFPLLLHQNAVEPGGPPSLCLYSEPLTVINRNWTPERFLWRIEDWLSRSATGTLHLDDQPVEQLFFVTGYELVLPYDFDERRADVNVKAWCTATEPRADNTCTFTLHWQQPRTPLGQPLLEVLCVELSPVEHGRPEEDPVNLGQIQDIFAPRGADFVHALRAAMLARVDSHGRQSTGRDAHTLILLEVPVSRQAGGAVERRFRRAFLATKGFLDLGIALEALIKHGDQYFADRPVGGTQSTQPMSTAWRDIPVVGVDVAQAMSRTLAHQHSGQPADGPNAVLVGAGSLGASLLEIWLRSAWGRWTVVDDDHIKPHNLVRHPAAGWAIGMNKAKAARNRAQHLFAGANPVNAIEGSGLDPTNAGITNAIVAAALVVDATADLDFPRQASVADGGPRHVSTFLTPSACDSVMIMEDAGRLARLRTLEAQYYRAVINESWGEKHLQGHRGKLSSGAGCRDMSVVMPYSAVMVHSATLAEQVQQASLSDAACMKVWQRDPSTGNTVAIELPSAFERPMQVGSTLVSIDEGLIQKLRAMREAKLPVETGGILLGYHDFNLKTLVVVDACAAPPDSVELTASFKRGIAGVKEVLELAANRTANNVQYIGEWHSHPPRVSAQPSSDDKVQVLNLASQLADEGLPALSLIVGDGADLSALLGKVT